MQHFAPAMLNGSLKTRSAALQMPCHSILLVGVHCRVFDNLPVLKLSEGACDRYL